MAMTTNPILELKLKKEFSYTSTPFWTFMACFRVNFTLYLRGVIK